ncbi:MAG TPA: glycosyltransferase family 2 protein [Puia sp.]|nr:glycosyltransferase family 2 protein [Puia sp.]
MIDLSIIIVNYKSAALTIDCLQSIYANTHQLMFEIIVVDNDSLDHSREIVLSRFPGVVWIDMGYNAGFARANNKGIAHSRAAAVLLLNPDTLLQDDAIDQCYHLFMASPYVACGVQLINPDHSPQISGNYFIRGGLNHLLPLPYLGAFIRKLGLVFGAKKPNIPDARSIVEVDWINGAFLMVKRDAIERRGLLDEDFFLYAEEAEWCSRLSKSGKLCLFGQIRVIHLQGESATTAFASSDKTYWNLFDRKGLQIMISNMLRIRKQFGSGWFLLMTAVYVFEIPVFFMGLVISRLLFGRKHRFSFFQLRGYSRNVARLVRTTPKIISGKPYLYKFL